MNILFLTMSNIRDIEDHGIYTDLMRKFRNDGHQVYIAAPRERRTGEATSLKEISGAQVLGVKTLNVQKTNVVEKGLGQVSMETLFKRAIKKYFHDDKFDLIIYSTPPITFVNAIKFVRRHNPQAKTYLLLKDIFPQNAVDIGMLSVRGVKGFLYRSFRRKEKQLYKVSDWIGCMSPANVQYVLDHNPEVDPKKVEIAPNSYEVTDYMAPSPEQVTEIRSKYHLPADKPIFIYGGNLGKPQGIPFLMDCLEANKDREDCHFVVVGSGTEYGKIEAWYKKVQPKSVSLFSFIPKEDYDKLVDSCDIGLIFLDYRFTIPNYPSRLLPYLMQHKPIIAATDPNCDTGSLAEANGYGFWCPSNSVEAFTACVDKMLAADIRQMGDRGYRFFLDNYTVQNTYDAIMKHFG